MKGDLIPLTGGCKHCDATNHYSEKCKWKKKVYERKRCPHCRRFFLPENAYQNRTSSCQALNCHIKQKYLDRCGMTGRAISHTVIHQCPSCLEPRHMCRCG